MEAWARVIKKWASLSANVRDPAYLCILGIGRGETPEWVARTLGHVDTSMVYKTYGRYIPNLTRQDGSAFERQYMEAANEKG